MADSSCTPASSGVVAVAVVALVLSAACSSDSGEESPEASGPARALGDVVLRAGDFPTGFEVSDEGASIDLTEPFAEVDECETIGVPDNAVHEGLVKGDVVVRGDPTEPPATAVVTAAMRVREASEASALLSEFESEAGQACVARASTPSGQPTVTRPSSTALVSTVAGGDGGYALVLIARESVLAAGIVAAIGEPLDADLVDWVTNSLEQRAA